MASTSGVSRLDEVLRVTKRPRGDSPEIVEIFCSGIPAIIEPRHAAVAAAIVRQQLANVASNLPGKKVDAFTQTDMKCEFASMGSKISGYLHRKILSDLPTATADTLFNKYHQQYLDDIKATVKTMLEEIRQPNLGIGCSVCLLTVTELTANGVFLSNYTGCGHVICGQCLIFDEDRRRAQKKCHFMCDIKRSDKIVPLFFN